MSGLRRNALGGELRLWHLKRLELLRIARANQRNCLLMDEPTRRANGAAAQRTNLIAPDPRPHLPASHSIGRAVHRARNMYVVFEHAPTAILCSIAVH